MNREDTIKVLSMVRANYPLVKIQDPAATVSAWQMSLSEYDTETVLKAVKFHMKTSKYFPTPADITSNITRAELLYKDETVKAIAPPKRAKVTAIPDGVTEEEYLDHIWQDMINLESECWPEADHDENLGGALPYEK